MKAEVAELGAHLQTSMMIKKELKGFEVKVKECQDEIDTLHEKESSLQEKVFFILNLNLSSISLCDLHNLKLTT